MIWAMVWRFAHIRAYIAQNAALTRCQMRYDSQRLKNQRKYATCFQIQWEIHMLDIGTPAPSFTLPRDGGENVELSHLQGRKVVLYFYPRDNTPGCTTEALDFTALKAEFDAANTVVMGISKDTVRKHDNFCAKHSLGIPLLSDADGTVCEDYGVWGEKSMYGKTHMGITRSTYLIDEAGNIAQVWPKVKVKDHAAAVLEAVKT
jgi:peroxiredoxin Q/BCP